MQLYDQREPAQTRFGSLLQPRRSVRRAPRGRRASAFPHYIVNFERRVPARRSSATSSREYAAGRTPIPCVHCNGDLKFATLVERAAGFDADGGRDRPLRARRLRRGRRGRYRLLRGVDRDKDQSYFLFSLTQEQLAHALVPGRRTRQGRRSARRRAARPAASRTSRTATRSASCPTATPPGSSSARRRACRAGAIVDDERPRARPPRGRPSLHGRPAQGPRPRRPGCRSTSWSIDAGDASVVVGPREELERDDADGVARELDRGRRRPPARSASPPASAIATATRRPPSRPLADGRAQRHLRRAADRRRRRDRRSCSTTATWCSAAAGSTDRGVGNRDVDTP